MNPTDPMTVLALKALSQSPFHPPPPPQSQTQSNSSSSKFFIADILGMKSDTNSCKTMPKKRLSEQLMNRHVLASRGILSLPAPPPPPPPPPPPQFSGENVFNSTSISKFGPPKQASNTGGNSSDYDDDDDDDDENLNDCGADDDGEDDFDSDQGE